MAYEFTKLSDVEIAEQPSTEANILIEDNGVIKKTLLSSVGGNGNSNEEVEENSGNGVEVINFTMGGYSYISDLENVQRAFDENMTFHVSHYDMNSDYWFHATFPRFKEFAFQREESGIETYAAYQYFPRYNATGTLELVDITFSIQLEEGIVTNANASFNQNLAVYSTIYATSI